MNVQIDVKSLEQGAYAAVMAGGTRALRELLATAEKNAAPAAAPAKRGRKPKTAATAETPEKAAKSSKRPKAGKGVKAPGKRIRRSAEDVEATGQKVLGVLASGRHSMEALVSATGLDRSELTLPIRKLVKDGKVSMQGKKRATTYAVAA